MSIRDRAIFITNPTNIRYLTGFVGVEQRDAYLLLLETKTYLFVSPLYQEEAKNIQFKNSFLQKHYPNIQTIEVIVLTPDKRITKQLQTICERDHVNNLQFESENLSVAEHISFKTALSPVILTPTQNIIETLRVKKFPSEIISIKKAAKLTDDCFTFIQTKIQKGVAESALAWEIETFFRKHGAQLAFSPIVAFGKNSSMPHYSNTSGGAKKNQACLPARQGSALKLNDIILLDFGAKVDSYCADMTRMIFVGKPKPEWIKAYKTVLFAQQIAIDKLSSFVSGTEIDRASRKILEDAGFPTYPHSLGHGVGLDIHEAPRITIHQDSVLSPSMVVTIEPATYIPNQFGIRIEDLLLITNAGIEVLSKSSKDVIILV